MTLSMHEARLRPPIIRLNQDGSRKPKPGLEQEVAAVLDQQGVVWSYETIGLWIVEEDRYLVCDFYLEIMGLGLEVSERRANQSKRQRIARAHRHYGRPIALATNKLATPGELTWQHLQEPIRQARIDANRLHHEWLAEHHLRP